MVPRLGALSEHNVRLIRHGDRSACEVVCIKQNEILYLISVAYRRGILYPVGLTQADATWRRNSGCWRLRGMPSSTSAKIFTITGNLCSPWQAAAPELQRPLQLRLSLGCSAFLGVSVTVLLLVAQQPLPRRTTLLMRRAHSSPSSSKSTRSVLRTSSQPLLGTAETWTASRRLPLCELACIEPLLF